MRKIFTGFVASLVVLTALAAQSQAGLVTVTIHNSGTSLPDEVQSGYTVSSTYNYASGGFVGSNQATWGFGAAASPAVVTYNTTGTNGFSGLFDAGKGSTTAQFLGFLLSISGNASLVGNVTFSQTDGSSTVSSGPYSFSGEGPHSILALDFLGSTLDNVTMTFNVTAGNLTFGSLSAVPEPSALMLVGSLVGLGLVRRRR